MPSKQKTETRPNIAPDSPEVSPDFRALQTFGFNNMTNFGTAWVEALSDMGSEVLTFVADRIKEDVKTQHEILHCDDMAKLQKIQAQFIQTAIDQYTAETGKLITMSQQFLPKTDNNDTN